MKKSLIYLVISGMIICLFSPNIFAKTGWVSDMLLLTFRSGPGSSHPVEKTLGSNTPVTILGEQNGFYKVELESKEVGWVDMKFIIFNPPKIHLIQKLKEENKTLENKIEQQVSLTRTLKEKIDSLENMYSGKISKNNTSSRTSFDEKKQLEKSLQESRDKYDTLIQQSENIETIVQENKTLKDKNARLVKERQTHKEKTRNFFKTDMIKWFLSGVAVLLTGWLFGRSITSKKQRSSSLLD